MSSDPFFWWMIAFTAGMCSFIGLLALITAGVKEATAWKLLGVGIVLAVVSYNTM